MSQTIFRKDFKPVSDYESAALDLYLFPTSLDFYESDYEAVMESKVLLRNWSMSDWPEDSFSLENREDLKVHIEDNHTHRAYGYMIYTLDKKRCLGSLYVNPLGEWPNYHRLTKGTDPRDVLDARLDFWIRESKIENLEEKFIQFLAEWFKNEWKIKAGIVSRNTLTKRNQIIQKLNLHQVCELTSLTTGGQTFIYKI